MNDRLPPQHSREPAAMNVTSAEAPSSGRYLSLRAATQTLVAPLSPEDCTIQSMPDASPVKWHLAHTTWFFETFVLEPNLRGYRPFHPSFRMLFNSYYNSVGDKHPRPKRGLLSRPTLDEVRAYRAHVDAEMARLLERGALPPDVGSLVELGLNHEQQHQELILTDVLHLFAGNPLKPKYAPGTASPERNGGRTGAQQWISHEGGVVEIGHDGNGFAFDNEGPRHRQYLNAYALGSRAITNGEYAAFIGDSGYRRPELWLSEGWDWLTAAGIEAPLYWERDDSGRSWLEFGLRGLRPLVENAPVCHVSLFEADAYARWAGARLPTEAEWEIAAAPCPVIGNFVESGAFEPRCDANAGPMAHSHAGPGSTVATDHGPSQLFGDVWEWTQSDYAAYPGYRPAAGAIGEYNGKFMSSQYVIRGGSCVSPQSHLRATYRNFFPASARWQFTGIRLARDAC